MKLNSNSYSLVYSFIQMVSEQQPRPPSTPPKRPLPLSPARGAQPKPSGGGLMVVMPPAIGPKPVGKVTAVPPLKAFQ